MSSQPTMLRSSGTLTPRSRRRMSMPMASRSLKAMQAVTPLASTTSAAAAPASFLGENGPTRRTATP